MKTYVMCNEPGASGVQDITKDQHFRCYSCGYDYPYIQDKPKGVPKAGGGTMPFVFANYTAWMVENEWQKHCAICSKGLWMSILEAAPVDTRITLYIDADHTHVSTWAKEFESYLTGRKFTVKNATWRHDGPWPGDDNESCMFRRVA